MAKLDDAGTTGFYSEQISLTDANGFELNKDYCIRITATVDGQTTATIYTFRIGPIDAIRAETAQAGAAGSITLDAGASAVDDFYKGLAVQPISGTGAGQVRLITAYNGTTKVATVKPNWTTNPGATSIFLLRPWNGVNVAAMENDTITAAALAADAGTEIGTAVWATAARTLTAATNITSTGGTIPITGGGLVNSDVAAISTDTAAADSLESVLDGTGARVDFTKVKVTAADAVAGVEVENSLGDGVRSSSTGGNGHGINGVGQGSGDGIRGSGGATNDSAGIRGRSAATNGIGIQGDGSGTRAGIRGVGGTTGHGIHGFGGVTSGHGIVGQAQGNGSGVRGIGGGTAGDSGIVGESGVSGHGIYGFGDGVGSGILGVGGASDGNGIEGVADAGVSTAQAHGFRGLGGINDGSGFSGAGQGNGHGWRTVGAGSGEGMSVQGGATGHGAEFTAGGGDRSGIVLTPSGNGTPFSANAGFIRSGIAQAGGASTITLDAAASAVNDFYKGALCHLSAGTGAGQTRAITAYDGTTKIATVAPAWATAPAVGTTFDLLAFGATTAAATADVNLVTWLGSAPNALIAGRVDANAQVVGDKTGYSLSAAGVDDIWDENIVAAHGTADTAGRALRTLDAISDRTNNSNLNDLLGVPDSIGGDVPGQTTDEVWDEALIAHTSAATMGANQNQIDDIETDTQNIQSRLPLALVGGTRMDSSVQEMAANVLTASALASDAVTEIRSIVSGTSDSGSTTTMVDTARTEADTDYWKGMFILFTSGTISGQVRLITAFDPALDQITFAPATTQAVSTQTYEILPNARVDLGLWLGSVPNALIAGRVDANAQVVGDKTGYSLTSAEEDAIVDKVWDEDIVAAHGGADSSGETLSQLTKRAAVLGTEVLDGSIIGQMLDDGVATYDRTTDSLQAIRDALPAAAPSAADNANAVWDELTAEARPVGSYGQLMKDDIDATISSRSTLTGAQAADAVWDEATAGHVTIGSFGKLVADINTDTLPGTIEGDVWNAARAGHAGAGTFGEGVASVQGNVTGNVNGNVVGSVGSVAVGGITAPSFAPGAIDAAALAASAGDEIIAAVSGTADAGSTALTIVDAARTEADVDYWASMIAYMVTGAAAGQARRISAFNPATDTLTVATAFTQAIAAGDQYLILRTAIEQPAAAGTTDWTAGERSQIRQALGVTGAVAATDGTGDLKTLTAAIQADTDDLQTRLPLALVGGRMDSSVGAMAANTLTALALDTSAVDEIVDQNWNELIAGHLGIGSTGEALNNAAAGGAADWTAAERSQIRQALGVTGAVAATDATGDLKTLTAALQADTDDIQARLPASLNGGRMRSHVEACDPPCAPAGGGGLTAAQVEAAVWDANKASHQGSTIMGNIAQDTDNQEFEIQPG
jgi:hypothetical protein